MNQGSMNTRSGTLWIGDLDPYMDETFLMHAFTLMGENMYHAKIIRNKETGYPLGYGFVDFGDEQTALKVLHRCNGKQIPNATTLKRFKLNQSSYGKEHLQRKEHSLFVGDLSPDVNDLALYTAFSQRYPSVKAANVLLDQSGISKGYGFIRFTNETEYQTALAEMQNVMLVGSKPIRVSIATPKRSFTPAVPGQEYQPYYPYSGYDYQTYYAAWQSYQQQYYGYGYDQSSYANYDPNNYQQEYSQYNETGYDNSDNIIEEHDIPLDIELMNEEAVVRNEEFYESLDNSRWLPIEGLEPPLVPVK